MQLYWKRDSCSLKTFINLLYDYPGYPSGFLTGSESDHPGLVQNSTIVTIKAVIITSWELWISSFYPFTCFVYIQCTFPNNVSSSPVHVIITLTYKRETLWQDRTIDGVLHVVTYDLCILWPRTIFTISAKTKIDITTQLLQWMGALLWNFQGHIITYGWEITEKLNKGILRNTSKWKQTPSKLG